MMVKHPKLFQVTAAVSLNHLTAGRHTVNRQDASPPLVKLLENGMSKWTGVIFDILDVLLSVPADKTGCYIKKQVPSDSVFMPDLDQGKMTRMHFLHLRAKTQKWKQLLICRVCI